MGPAHPEAEATRSVRNARPVRHAGSSSGGCARLQGEGMKLTTHAALQGRVDHLVLGDTRLATELFGDDLGAPVIIVAGKVLERDLRVRKGVPQIGFERRSLHRHG